MNESTKKNGTSDPRGEVLASAWSRSVLKVGKVCDVSVGGPVVDGSGREATCGIGSTGLVIPWPP